ncbi:hypothetical protein [Pedobacter suwonensis]|uniref:hypothetical protein n=1 Tax=Pedobacter suwonensis TaxID=332999 RepID=UPI0011A88CDD|nr:hypothetical protein [Pedobacter suwonensis]
MSKSLARYKNKEFVVIKHLSFEEQATIEVMFQVINDFDVQNLKFEIVRDIYQEMLDTLQSGKPSHILFRQLMELMSTFNAFLNHWNTSLKRTFGENSKNYNDFKKSTAEQYDNHFEYRFLYGLRNYIHHCGMPNIMVTSKLDENENQVHHFMVNKTELIEGMDWKKRILSDFASMNESFDIFPYFKVLIQCVTRIHTIAINNIDTVKLLICAQRMITYKKYLDDDNTQLVLFGYSTMGKEDAPKNLHWEQFKFDLAEYLIKQIKPTQG